MTDAFAKGVAIELTPQYEVDNLSMAISLIVSTGGIALMPDYARNLLPPTVTGRPLAGKPPTIDLTLGYRNDNPVPQLPAIMARLKRMQPAASGSA